MQLANILLYPITGEERIAIDRIGYVVGAVATGGRNRVTRIVPLEL